MGEWREEVIIDVTYFLFFPADNHEFINTHRYWFYEFDCDSMAQKSLLQNIHCRDFSKKNLKIFFTGFTLILLPDII